MKISKYTRKSGVFPTLRKPECGTMFVERVLIKSYANIGFVLVGRNEICAKNIFLVVITHGNVKFDGINPLMEIMLLFVVRNYNYSQKGWL
jgi:hypothetical protein